MCPGYLDCSEPCCPINEIRALNEPAEFGNELPHLAEFAVSAGYSDVSGAVFFSRPRDHSCHVRTDEATTTAPKA